MGCGSSSPVLDPAAEARNRQIDRALENEKQAQKLTLKVLLLGNGESGKSTVLKQMIIIHKGGFQAEERLAYRDIIYSNTLQSVVAVIEALPSLGLLL